MFEVHKSKYSRANKLCRSGTFIRLYRELYVQTHLWGVLYAYWLFVWLHVNCELKDLLTLKGDGSIDNIFL